MKWILQELLNNYSNVMKMEESLKRLGIEYIVVNLSKNNIRVINKILRVEEAKSEELFNDFISEGEIFCYGGKALIELSEKFNLKPGCYFSKQLSFDYLKANLGEELLNFDFQKGRLKDLEMKEEKAFIRPVENSKLFTGLVVTKQELEEWKCRENSPESLFSEEELMITSVKNVCQEFRFFVYNGEIVTYSSYCSEGSYNCEIKAPEGVISYANEIIRKHSLPKAYVLDIAIVEGDFKVVEINCINTSALYNSDVDLLAKRLSFS